MRMTLYTTGATVTGNEVFNHSLGIYVSGQAGAVSTIANNRVHGGYSGIAINATAGDRQ